MKRLNKLLAFLTVFLMVLGNFCVLPALAEGDDDLSETARILCDKGRISLHKVDDTGANVAGAKYSILWEVGGYWVSYFGFTMTTGADGVATSEPLLAGISYKVAEIDVPWNYELNPTPSDPITVVKDQTTSFPNDFTNVRKRATVHITKNVLDCIYNGDAQFSFAIVNKATGESFTGSVTGEGTCDIDDVPYGVYTLDETSIPAGFAFHSFIELIDGRPCLNPTTELNVNLCHEFVICNNIRTANIRITKDDGNGKMLSGAQFELYKKVCDDWELVDLGYVPETNSLGICDITGLPFGKYKVIEIVAPMGYEIDNEMPKPQRLDDINETVTFEFQNKQKFGSITVNKTVVKNEADDADDPDFTVEITGPSNNPNVASATTSHTIQSGTNTIGGLAYGDYTITEANEPGYASNPVISPDTFTIDDNHQTNVVIDITNKKLYGKITVTKSFVDGALPDGTVLTFDLYKGDSSLPDDSKTFTVGTDNEIAFNYLEYGETYTVKEQPIDGYQSNGDYTVKIGDETLNNTFACVNTKQFGSAVVSKAVTNYASAETFHVRLVGTYHDQTVYDQVIDVPADDADGVPVPNLPYGHYTIAEETVPDGYRLVSISPQVGFDINDESRSVEIVVTNEGFGSIKILKLDSRSTEGNKIPVPGTHFEVYYLADGGKVVVLADGVTGADGTLTVPNLLVGRTYYAREIGQAPGYNLVEATRTYALSVPGSTVTADAFVNDPIGRVSVEKKDSVSGAMLGGVEFGIYRTEADANADLNRLDKITTATSGADLGKATSKDLVLTAGVTSFWVVELAAPDGYVLDKTARKVDVTFTGRSVPVGTLTVSNDPFVRLVINKYDAATVVNGNYDSATKLAGAVFGIFKDSACTQQVGASLTTGASPLGTVSVNLPFGGTNPATYWVKELAAPAGYILSGTAPVAVTYTANDTPGKTVTVNFINPRDVGSIIVKKIDALDNTKTLAGAQFKLYSDAALTTQVGAAVTTGSDGIARFDNLAPGNYYLKETVAPTNYDLPAAAVPVTVTAGVTNPSPLVITNQYNPPEDIATGMMDYNILLLGGLGLAGGASLLLFTRKKKNMRK